jgi:hypothetical protein
MNRRRFLKYATATAGVVGASALGLDYLIRPQNVSLKQTTSNVTLTPPKIEGFQWQPTRIVNGKVYDATLSFTVKDMQSLASVTGTIEDYAPTIPAAAYPAEPPRTLQLVSSQITGNGAGFSTNVNNLKGGKQYKSRVKAMDSAGQQSSEEFKTPYVREFENAAASDGILFSAPYLFFQSGGWGYWDPQNGTPLLGNYDSGDNLVAAKHIDWATGFGISALALIWLGPSHYSSHMIRNLLAHPLIEDVKYFIFYDSLQLSGPQLRPGPWSVDDPAIRRNLLDGLDYLIQNNFLDQPSYLTVHGAHPIYFQGTLGWQGNIDTMMRELREKARQSGIDLFIIGDSVEYYTPNLNRIKPFDAITQFTNYSLTDPEINMHLEQDMDANYKVWTSTAKTVGAHFIPSAIPGYRKPIWPDFLVTPRNLQRFKNQIEIGKKYLDPVLKMFLISTFNDWTENHQVEPSVEEGFGYLQAIRESAT